MPKTSLTAVFAFTALIAAAAIGVPALANDVGGGGNRGGGFGGLGVLGGILQALPKGFADPNFRKPKFLVGRQECDYLLERVHYYQYRRDDESAHSYFLAYRNCLAHNSRPN